MKTTLDCVPCFLRQALEAARSVTDDVEIHKQVMDGVLRLTVELDLEQSPPAVGQQIHRLLRKLTSQVDPYRDAKDRFNHLALNLFPDLSAQIRTAEDPLALALQLAIAGNVIDLGVHGLLTEAEVRRDIDETLNNPFVGDLDAFKTAIRNATSILYIADNAGEIVLDRLLIEQLPVNRVTVAVRGQPVINDATLADAQAAGLHELVEIVDNGSDAPGTILEDCSPAFQKRFDQADLIIAKGQGNFETLSDVRKKIFFLFKAKCSVIAEHVGLEIGTLALLGSTPCPNEQSGKTNKMG